MVQGLGFRVWGRVSLSTWYREYGSGLVVRVQGLCLVMGVQDLCSTPPSSTSVTINLYGLGLVVRVQGLCLGI